MELDSQRQAPSPFLGGSVSSTQNTLEPLMPLLPNPMSAGMMIPASPARDKHLRNLLASRALQQLEAEQDGGTQSLNKGANSGESTSQSSSVTGSVVTTPCMASPVMTFSGHSLGCDTSLAGGTVSGEDSLNGGLSSGYFSENSGFDRLSNISSSSSAATMIMTKDSRAMNIYKFKHNITKRFSQEGKVISQPLYDSLSSSRDFEDDRQGGHHVKHRSSKGKSRHASSSDSGPYPTSECSSGHASGTSHDSSSSSSGIEGVEERSRTRACKVATHSSSSSDFTAIGGDCCSRSLLPLPGFVLHPSGTHYMPMSVCHANIPDMFDSGMEAAPGQPVFHPISIPVHFRGPVISMPNINLCTSTHARDSCSVGKLTDSGTRVKDSKEIKCSKKQPQ